MEIQYSDWTFDSRDEYLRRPIAENVIRLLQSEVRVSPMAIDGGWGTGKTEFCHKLINLINAGDSGYRAIYVDAFKADHADEPLLTLLAEVLRLVPEGEKREGVIRRMLPAVRFGLKTISKAAVSHLLRQDAAQIVEGFESEVKDVADKSIDAAVETLLKDHVKAGENLETLKSTLRELAEGEPIVIFVDELDRCRPDFAVTMLETIKHVFDVEKVKFVLVTNTDQLRAAINHRYGSSVDAQRYLDKFLGFSFTLPAFASRSRDEPALASVIHCYQLTESSPILADTKLREQGVFSLLSTLIEVNQLSLRQVETFARNLEIYQALTDSKGLRHDIVFGYLVFRVFAIFIFTFSPSSARQLAHSYVDSTRLNQFLGQNRFRDLDDDHTYPDSCAEAMAALIGFESSTNRDEFELFSETSRARWKYVITNYFSGHYTPAANRGVKQIMIDAINLMSLR